jgi:hypothetical protein
MTDYFLFSLKNRLTIFNYTLYLSIIEEYIIKYLKEWDLLNDYSKVSKKTSYYYDFLYKVLKEEIKKLKNFEKENHCKSLILINLHKKGKYSKYFENYDLFLKQNIKALKKLHKNVVLTELDFTKTNGLYKNIQCIQLSGDEEEFLNKLKNV